MTRKLAGFGLAFALAELAAAYLPPLASLLTAALFISLFLFAAFTQRRAARFALPAVAGLLAGLVWSAAYQLALVKPAQSLAGQTYACTAIVQPDAETSWQPGNVRATLLITQLDGRKTTLSLLFPGFLSQCLPQRSVHRRSWKYRGYRPWRNRACRRRCRLRWQRSS